MTQVVKDEKLVYQNYWRLNGQATGVRGEENKIKKVTADIIIFILDPFYYFRPLPVELLKNMCVKETSTVNEWECVFWR